VVTTTRSSAESAVLIVKIKMKRIIILLTILLTWTTALSVCDRPEPKLCKSFFNDKLVIHARVKDIRTVHDQDDPEGLAAWLFYLDVSKVYRGKIGSSLVALSENTTARIVMEKGKEYFVFASFSPDGIWETENDCDDYSGAEYSKPKEQEIFKLLKDKEAHFYGEVVLHADGGAPVPNVEIKIIGEKNVYTAKSDSKGNLKADLQPGKYKIEMPKGIEKSIISFADLDNINLAAGQCEQVRFIKK
jgi:hypothetical protein